MNAKEPTEVKGPTEVNFKRTYPLLSHFQNDVATVECSTLVLLQIRLETP